MADNNTETAESAGKAISLCTFDKFATPEAHHQALLEAIDTFVVAAEVELL